MNARTRVLVVSGLRNFLIWRILYNPWNILLQILPIWTDIDTVVSNQEPRLRAISTGFIVNSPTVMESIEIFDNLCREPPIKTSVLESLINKRF